MSQADNARALCDDRHNTPPASRHKGTRRWLAGVARNLSRFLHAIEAYPSFTNDRQSNTRH